MKPLSSRGRMAPLSSREREVCVLTLAGCTLKEIGRRLTLSPRTIEQYRCRIFAKYGVNKMADLVIKLHAEAE